MRRYLRTRLLALAGSILVVLSTTAPAAAARPANPLGGPDEGSWIVMLAPGQSAPQAAPELTRAVGGQVGLTYTHAINGFQFKGSAAAAEALRRNPNVVSVSPDRPISLTGETLPTGIERVAAYDNDTPGAAAYHNGYRGNGARIAVLDTGIDLDHPDLAASIDLGTSKNCVNTAAAPDDGYGHGTHVAGTAAAPLNGVGVVGIAPEAELVAVKVFDDAGNSSESLVLCGFDHVMALNADADSSNDIDVMNMSFGEQRAWGDCVTDAMHAAVCAAHAAGVIMVAGSGNSAVDGGTFVPAAFPEVISVSALTDFDTVRGGLAGCKFILELFSTECDDTLAIFSNYGASVDVVAPGVFIYSTWPGGTYKTSSGTSMATPHVTGVVAIMAAAVPGLTPADALAYLRSSGECPDGTVAGVDGTCDGQGTWPDDPDGVAEPMLNALGSAVAATGVPPAPTPPGAPKLNAATSGDGSVALAWNAPGSTGGSPITGYEIWRGTTSGGAALLTSVGVQTSYTDTSVSNGTTYYYQVAAVNAVGTGPGSNERSATPTPPTPPGAPNLTSATAGDGSVALAWTAPASNGGSPITGYEVRRGTTSGGETVLTAVGVQTSYTDMTVTNGTTYYYQVAAVNAIGTGSGSNERSATPISMVSRLGSASTNFASVSSNAGSMSFNLPAGTERLVAMVSIYTTTTTVTSMTWKPNPANPALNQAMTLVGRQVASGNGAVEIWELANPTPGVAGSSISHTLSASAKRAMGVHALDGVAGRGAPVGAGVNGTSISVNVPSQPGALVLDVLFGYNSTTAHTAGAGQSERWNLNTTGGTGNLRGAGSSEAGAASTTMSWTSGTGTHHALLAVSYTPAEPGEPPAPTPPGAPNLSAANAGNASVALTWSAPGSTGGSPITGYEIWRGTTSGGAALLTSVGVQTSYTDTSVSNGTTYYYQVAAVNAVGTGPGSNERSATPTEPPTPPGAPNLTSATAGDGSVALAWTAPASNGGSPITGYEVWRGTTSGGATLLTSVGLVTTYTDATAANGTTYYYQVAAVNAAGTGPGSNERSATPTAPPPTPPGAPNLTSATAGNASVALAWSAPASNGGSPITGYEIWRGTTSAGATLLTSVGLQTTFTDSTVTNDTTYYYQVAAVNAAGTGPGSNERSATPTSLVPVTRLGGASTNFASLAGTSGSLTFTLPAGTDRLVAMISLFGTGSTVTSMTWRPDPGNAALNQAMTLVGRQAASGNGAVEIWELANPTPGVAGSSISHTLNVSTKRVMGVHALDGVGGRGAPVGAGVNAASISVSVPSQAGALVLDVVYGQNSTTAHTAGAGQADRWNLNTTGGVNNLRGAGSTRLGAASTTMSWTSGAATHHALLAVSYNPH